MFLLSTMSGFGSEKSETDLTGLPKWSASTVMPVHQSPGNFAPLAKRLPSVFVGQYLDTASMKRPIHGIRRGSDWYAARSNDNKSRVLCLMVDDS